MVFISGKYLRHSIESFLYSFSLFVFLSPFLSLSYYAAKFAAAQVGLHYSYAACAAFQWLFPFSFVSLSWTLFCLPSSLVFSEKRLGAVCCIHYEPLSQAGDKKRRCHGAGHEAAFMRFALVTNAPYLMPAHVLLLLLLPLPLLHLLLLPALPCPDNGNFYSCFLRWHPSVHCVFSARFCRFCLFASLLVFMFAPASLFFSPSLQLSLFRILFLKMQFSLKFIAIFLRFLVFTKFAFWLDMFFAFN